MNYKETNRDYFEVLLDKEKSWRDKVCSHFSIPSHGILFVFDTEDYKEYPEGSRWRDNLGMCINIKYDYYYKDPKKLKQLIRPQNRKYQYLIWFSKQAWSHSKIDFIWNLAHELKHVSHEHDLLVMSNSLLNHFGPMCAPAEIDADLVAYKISCELVGWVRTVLYVCKNRFMGSQKLMFKALLKHIHTKEYKIFEEIESLLVEHQDYFAPYGDQVEIYLESIRKKSSA